MDYINGEGGEFTDIKHVKKIAKIIEDFDGRETVELRYSHPHSGYLRGIQAK